MCNHSKSNKQANKTETHVLSLTLHLNKEDKILYVPLQFNEYENHALLHKSAIQSAMSEAELCKKQRPIPMLSSETYPPPNFKIQITNGIVVPVRKQVLLRFYVAGKVFEENVFNSTHYGNNHDRNVHFETYTVNLDIRNQLVHFPIT